MGFSTRRGMRSNKESKSFSSFCRDIKQYKMMTRAEERAAFERLRAGDESAREEIVNANLPFLVSSASKFFGSKLPLEDLLQEAAIGMMEAIDRFDPTKGVPFVGFAKWNIRAHMQKASLMQPFVVTLPKRYWVECASALKVETEMNEGAGNMIDSRPTAKDIAERAGVSVPVAMTAEIMRYGNMSLDEDMFDDGIDATDKGTMYNWSELSVPAVQDDIIDVESKKKLVNEILDISTDKQRDALERVFGLDGNGSRWPREVGDELCTSRQNIEFRIHSVREKATSSRKISKMAREVLDYV